MDNNKLKQQIDKTKKKISEYFGTHSFDATVLQNQLVIMETLLEMNKPKDASYPG